MLDKSQERGVLDKSTIERMARVASESDAASFVARHPAPALVTGVGREGDGKKVDTRRHTRPASLDQKTDKMPATSLEDTHEDARSGDDRASAPESDVFFIVKTPRNPFAHMITVGRAGNNDLQIDDPTVS